ncbi:molybdate transport system substrate-binding protein [Geosporobacter subterraneus DSM 17957]|uniref:Molybdate transport system substrate-binding protein n=1 Tax=Geosporobacter subterraneus DSM 17957 TaxID=1121919 RepID=A0A1M6EL59_9FIRM|nr:molybdate ABC transporter substrate-binding protein [Geosporobacter subterraneus]SHI86136.1 molybdate transport system substrate-binding protein [Geosporobacter subterraneus DSM 17957]
MKRKMVALALTLLAIALVGCTNNGNSSTAGAQSTTKPELTVAAAADLTKAFTEIGKAFEVENNCTVTFSFGSTGTLSEQIANGAPFDVFAAANESVIDELDHNGHIISETRSLYALGRIGITTLKDSTIKATTMEELLNPKIKKIAIANPDHAPYGLAAKQALVSAGLWKVLEPKMVYGKNISETLTFITTGNAEAGFIALSLNDEDTLNFSLVDADMHEPLRQAIAVIEGAKEEELGKKFIEYILSDKGQKIMNTYGFVLPEE